MNEIKCEVCGAVAVDVWLDPRYPGHLLWVCQEDLYDLIELERVEAHILNLGESKEEN